MRQSLDCCKKTKQNRAVTRGGPTLLCSLEAACLLRFHDVKCLTWSLVEISALYQPVIVSAAYADSDTEPLGRLWMLAVLAVSLRRYKTGLWHPGSDFDETRERCISLPAEASSKWHWLARGECFNYTSKQCGIFVSNLAARRPAPFMKSLQFSNSVVKLLLFFLSPYCLTTLPALFSSICLSISLFFCLHIYHFYAPLFIFAISFSVIPSVSSLHRYKDL